MLGGCGTVLLQPQAQLLFLPSGQTIESNWRCGRHNLQRIQCRSENSKGVYCLQYDDEKIISGLRDNSIKVSASLCPFPAGEWGSALGSCLWCLLMSVCVCVWLVRVGCLSLAKSHLHSALEAWGTARDPFRCKDVRGHQCSHRRGEVSVLLSVAVSLPGICFRAHPPWHSFGQTGFGLLMRVGYFTVLSKTYIKTSLS